VTRYNTFTWDGPSGVVGCTGQARVARLGQAAFGPTTSRVIWHVNKHLRGTDRHDLITHLLGQAPEGWLASPWTLVARYGIVPMKSAHEMSHMRPAARTIRRTAKWVITLAGIGETFAHCRHDLRLRVAETVARPCCNTWVAIAGI
jgi:hypothetical protein